jgi:hypothetical protein
MNKPISQPLAPAETGHPPVAPSSAVDDACNASQSKSDHERIQEIGGRKDGTEPTRFGDWEKGGRCIDF